MKKTVLLIISCLLTLVSCQSDDEPTPKNTKPCVIVLRAASGQGDQILTLNGDTIYTASTGCEILKIAADGVDWYAAVKNGDKYHILKNGKTVYSTDNVIKELEAYDHHYYTLQKETINEYWVKYCVYKDKSYQYELLSGDYISMRINEPIADSGNNHAEVIIEGTTYKGMGVCVDGEYPDLPNVNQGVNVYSVDYVHGNLAFYYRDQTTGKPMYYYKGQTYEISDDDLVVFHLRLVNGTPYIFGLSGYSTVVYAGTQRVTVLEESMTPQKSILHDNDIYVLYEHWAYGTVRCIYKNNKRLEQAPTLYAFKDFAVLNITQ